MGWRDLTPHQRFFSELSGGDRRQVWAADSRLGPEGDLFYLEPGDAPAVRAKGLVNGILRCPFPGCPYPVFLTARGQTKRDHFVHERDPGVDHFGPEAAALYAANLVRHWVRRQHLEAEVAVLPGPSVAGTSTVVVRSAESELAFIFVGRLLGTDERGALRAAVPATAEPWWLIWNRSPLLEAGDNERAGTGRGTAGRNGFVLSLGGRFAWLSPDERLIAFPLGKPSQEFTVVVRELLDVPFVDGSPEIPDQTRLVFESMSAAGATPVGRQRAMGPAEAGRAVEIACRSLGIRELRLYTKHGHLRDDFQCVVGDLVVRWITPTRSDVTADAGRRPPAQSSWGPLIVVDAPHVSPEFLRTLGDHDGLLVRVSGKPPAGEILQAVHERLDNERKKRRY